MKVQDPVGLEARLAHLEWAKLISRMASVEATALSSSVRSVTLTTEVKDLLQEHQSPFNSFDPEKESISVSFDDLHVPKHEKMKEWVLEYIPSLNYGAVADFYPIFEHVNHQAHPSKQTSENLESLHNLEIPAMDHIITVTSLDYKVPKLFKNVK